MGYAMSIEDDRPTYVPNPAAERRGVALCLSGGGFRAALFHLGAVRRLNECGILSRVDTISSVSGGSILAAHLANAVGAWPAAGDVVPDWEVRVAAPFREFAQINLRTWLPLLGMVEQMFPIGMIRGAAERRLADRYTRRLTRLRFSQLPDRPRFVFCATDLVFGIYWAFDSGVDGRGRGRFGDYQAGHVHPAPDWFVARAVTASSCFPPVFNPVPAGVAARDLTQGRYQDVNRDALVSQINLGDGGIYDNLGLEPVWKDHAALLVSDGGSVFGPGPDQGLVSRVQRYSAIISEQGHAVRKRWLISNFIAGQMTGAYWGIGSTTSHYSPPGPGYSPRAVRRIAAIRTDLDAFSSGECKILENHGYLLADAAVRAHLTTVFDVVASAPRVPHPEWFNPDLGGPDQFDERISQELAASSKTSLLGRNWARFA